MEVINNQFGQFEDSYAERLAVLETKFDAFFKDQEAIRRQLDELLTLKSKGLGALWLIGLIMSTGLIGIIATINGFFSSRGHL